MTSEQEDLFITSLARIANSLEQQVSIMEERNHLLKVTNALAEDSRDSYRKIEETRPSTEVIQTMIYGAVKEILTPHLERLVKDGD